MSTVKISANPSGTGTVTIAAPNTNTNRTLTLPDNSGTIITSGSTTGIDASALSSGTVAVSYGGTGANTLTANNVILGNGTSAVQFVAPGTNGNVLTSNGTTWTSASVSGTITTTTGSAPYYGARAWVNFNGTGTVAIRASSNVSSITDSGTGLYTVNFTTAMPDSSYTINGNCGRSATIGYDFVCIEGTDNMLTGSAKISCRATNQTTVDQIVVSVAIYR